MSGYLLVSLFLVGACAVVVVSAVIGPKPDRAVRLVEVEIGPRLVGEREHAIAPLHGGCVDAGACGQNECLCPAGGDLGDRGFDAGAEGVRIRSEVVRFRVVEGRDHQRGERGFLGVIHD